MKYTLLLLPAWLLSGVAVLNACQSSASDQTKVTSAPVVDDTPPNGRRVVKTNAEWKKTLTAYQYAVLREALSNVARPAQASSVDVTISVGADICLEVVDNGAGVPAEHRRGSGLRNMARRAEMFGGSFEVDSPTGAGTRLRWRVPLQP